MSMWQQLLERFVPLMDADVSTLDRRDGVGSSIGPGLSTHARSTDATAPAGRTRTAYEGSISPLTS
ncbi:MAG: hypothetical protein ABIO48_13215 [Pedococcus sp.]